MSDPSPPPPPPPLPQAWGRLERILLQNVKLSDHVELVRSEHRFGRLESVCDVVLDAGYISRRHCSIVLDSMDSQTNEPVAYLVSNSVHDVFVNKEAVQKGKRVPLREGSMIHFTQPGARQPHAYRLHILREGLTPENRRLRKQLKEWLDLTSSRAKTRKRLRVEASDTQGSANESDGMPVAARTRSQPERKRQRRESSEPEPAFVTQDENTDSSNFGMVLRSKTPSPGSKAAGKRRRRSGPEEEEETQESLQGLAPEDLQLNHENRIQKQQISSLQRELEKLKDALLERELSEKQSREQTVVAQEAAKTALEEARMAREDAESSRVALAVASAQHAKEVDEMVYTQHELERNVARLEGKLRTCQSDRNREILQMDSQLKKKDSRIMSLEARVNELQQRTQDVVSSSAMSTSRTEAFKRQKVVLITQTVNELANPPTGMDSQEGSEESPSLIGNRRVSQDSNAENEASPDTPERQFSGGPARPVDVPIHVMAQMGDESKLGSSQELSQSQLTQSQSESQLTPPQSQSVPAQPTSVITNPYRGRSTRRVLTTSPDEEVKRQQ